MAATWQVTTIKAMNMVQVYIKGQEDKELSSFLRYYPVRIKNIGMDAFFDRRLSMISRMVETMQMWRSAWQRCLSKSLVVTFAALSSLAFLQAVRSVTRHATRTSLNLSASFLEQSTAFPMSRLLANVPQFMAQRSRRKSEQSA